MFKKFRVYFSRLGIVYYLVHNCAGHFSVAFQYYDFTALQQRSVRIGSWGSDQRAAPRHERVTHASSTHMGAQGHVKATDTARRESNDMTATRTS